LPTLSSSVHRNIFTSDFNFGFGCPRSDTCLRCEVIACKDDLLRHKKNAEEAFSRQRIDRDAARKGETNFITFDMEKTLPCTAQAKCWGGLLPTAVAVMLILVLVLVLKDALRTIYEVLVLVLESGPRPYPCCLVLVLIPTVGPYAASAKFFYPSF